MPAQTMRDRLLEQEQPIVARLEGEKAARFKASSMLLPCPAQVRAAIRAIPAGTTKTMRELRGELAHEAGAGVTCPRAANLCWEIVAEQTERDRAAGIADIVPWWRLTKDRKPNPKLPGGEDRHRSLLREEGVSI